VNPSNECQSCQPGSSTTSWTSVSNGNTCGGGSRVCSSGACSDGCFIGGQFFGNNTANPGNACEVCRPGTSINSWTRRNTGDSCGGTGQFCSNNSCSTGCFVSGSFFSSGTQNPGNQCQSCQPFSNDRAWTNTTGSSCGSGQFCSSGTCSTGCFINGSFYSNGTQNPGNQCQSCQTFSNATSWSNTSGSCSGGTCVSGTCQPPVNGTCSGVEGQCNTGVPGGSLGFVNGSDRPGWLCSGLYNGSSVRCFINARVDWISGGTFYPLQAWPVFDQFYGNQWCNFFGQGSVVMSASVSSLRVGVFGCNRNPLGEYQPGRLACENGIGGSLNDFNVFTAIACR